MLMSQQVVISGVGVWHPKDSVTNEELVDSYNAYVDAFNEDNKAQIDAGEIAAMPYSSAEFIERHLVSKAATFIKKRVRLILSE